MGTVCPALASPSTIAGTACAASSLFTVTRTISLPASASWITWRMVAAASAVSVLVIDWTTTGWAEPTRTLPTRTEGVFRRVMSAIDLKYSRAFGPTGLLPDGRGELLHDLSRGPHGVDPHNAL